jgi:hypothetical protein
MMMVSKCYYYNVKLDCGVVITGSTTIYLTSPFTAVSTETVRRVTIPNPTIDLVIPVNNVPLPTKKH